MQHSRLLISVAALLLFIKLLAAYTLNIADLDKGEYKYQYRADDIWEEHEGKLDENGDPYVNGSFSFFIGETQYIVDYYADKTGYHPTITVTVPTANDTQVGLPPRFGQGAAGG